MTTSKVKAVLSLGSNLGDRNEQLKEALKCLKIHLTILKKSKIYEAAPYGEHDQPAFLNMVCIVETDLQVGELLLVCKQIEEALGREARDRWKEREIDIDIIYYGKEIIDEDNLMVPHSDMQNRRFVLVPLREIAPRMVHPIFKKTTAQLLRECADSSIVQAK